MELHFNDITLPSPTPRWRSLQSLHTHVLVQSWLMIVVMWCWPTFTTHIRFISQMSPIKHFCRCENFPLEWTPFDRHIKPWAEVQRYEPLPRRSSEDVPGQRAGSSNRTLYIVVWFSIGIEAAKTRHFTYRKGWSHWQMMVGLCWCCCFMTYRMLPNINRCLVITKIVSWCARTWGVTYPMTSHWKRFNTHEMPTYLPSGKLT